jgi:hypothetical protein
MQEVTTGGWPAELLFVFAGTQVGCLDCRTERLAKADEVNTRQDGM